MDNQYLNKSAQLANNLSKHLIIMLYSVMYLPGTKPDTQKVVKNSMKEVTKLARPAEFIGIYGN